MYRNNLLDQSGDVESKEKALARLEASKEQKSKEEKATRAESDKNQFLDPEGPPPIVLRRPG